jgi:hypothetical protein
MAIKSKDALLKSTYKHLMDCNSISLEERGNFIRKPLKIFLITWENVKIGKWGESKRQIKYVHLYSS